jgi:hypothetical protein
LAEAEILKIDTWLHLANRCPDPHSNESRRKSSTGPLPHNLHVHAYFGMPRLSSWPLTSALLEFSFTKSARAERTVSDNWPEYFCGE